MIKRVLIIDDVIGDAERLSQEFKELIVTADDREPAPYVTSIEDAVAELRTNRFDVVILDLAFQEVEDAGLRVLRFLRAMKMFDLARAETPVVVVTGRHSVDLAVRAMRLGAADVVLKGTSDKPQIDETTIERVFMACSEAVRRAEGADERDAEQWWNQCGAKLCEEYAEKYIAVFSEQSGIPEATHSSGRLFLVFDNQEQALMKFTEHLEWLDELVDIRFVPG